MRREAPPDPLLATSVLFYDEMTGTVWQGVAAGDQGIAGIAVALDWITLMQTVLDDGLANTIELSGTITR